MPIHLLRAIRDKTWMPWHAIHNCNINSKHNNMVQHNQVLIPLALSSRSSIGVTLSGRRVNGHRNTQSTSASSTSTIAHRVSLVGLTGSTGDHSMTRTCFQREWVGGRLQYTIALTFLAVLSVMPQMSHALGFTLMSVKAHCKAAGASSNHLLWRRLRKFSEQWFWSDIIAALHQPR